MFQKEMFFSAVHVFLSWFYPNFIQILSKLLYHNFVQIFLETPFIQILSCFYLDKISIKSGKNQDKIWIKGDGQAFCNIKNDIDDGIFFYNFTFTWISVVTFGVIIAVNQFYLSFLFVRLYKSYPMHKWYRKDFYFSRLSKSIFLEQNPEFAIEIKIDLP
jgi:hypothetical protein